MPYTSIYKKDGCVKMDYNSETGVIYVTWKKMYDQNDTRYVCEQTLKLVKSGAKVIIIDLSKAEGVILKETQDWFQTYLFPNFARAGTLRVLITIDSQLPVVRLASSRWTHEGEGFDFDRITVCSKEEAAKVAVEYLSK